MRVYYGTLILANQRPGDPVEYPAKDIVDAGFLELVGYGIRDAHDPLIRDSLRVVDAVLKVETPFGPCWHRYNHDGFGQREAGFSIYIFLGGREPLGRERLRNRIAEPAAAERTRKAAQET
jgi:GH15 family glucan-1,4-alpha-glucosidase